MPTLRTVGSKDVAQANVNASENPPPAVDDNGEGTGPPCAQFACSPDLKAVDKNSVDNDVEAVEPKYKKSEKNEADNTKLKSKEKGSNSLSSIDKLRSNIDKLRSKSSRLQQEAVQAEQQRRLSSMSSSAMALGSFQPSMWHPYQGHINPYLGHHLPFFNPLSWQQWGLNSTNYIGSSGTAQVQRKDSESVPPIPDVHDYIAKESMVNQNDCSENHENKESEKNEEDNTKLASKEHAVMDAESVEPKNKETEKDKEDKTKLKPINKTSSCAYRGVCKRKGSSKYQSTVWIEGKNLCMGKWTLSADAALAYDEGNKILGAKFEGLEEMIKRLQRLNFKTHRQYTEARDKEIKELGLDTSKIDSSDRVFQKIKDCIDVMQSKLTSKSAVDSVSANHATAAVNSKSSPEVNDTVHAEVQESALARNTNFETTQEYQQARDQELIQRQNSVIDKSINAASTTAKSNAKKKRKRQHKSNGKVSKRLNSKLNEMTDVLTKKWGPFFVQDSSLANCMESLQRDITRMLAKNTSSTDHDPMSIESVSSLHSEERSATHPNTINEIASNSSESSIAMTPPTAFEEANVTVTTMVPMPEALYASFDKEVAKESVVKKLTNSVECAQSISCTMEDNFGTLLGDKQGDDEDPPKNVQKSTEQVETSNGCTRCSTCDKGSIENNVTEEKDVDPKEDTCCDASPAFNLVAPSAATQSSNVLKSTKASVNINECELFPLNADQINTLPFPIGCHVWSNFTTMTGGATFQCGTLVCASFNFVNRQVYYKVKLNDGNTVWFDELAFGPTCPIYYYPTNMSDSESGIPGEVMLVSRLENSIHYYTAIVSSNESGKYKVIEDIPASQIKYRKAGS